MKVYTLKCVFQQSKAKMSREQHGPSLPHLDPQLEKEEAFSGFVVEELFFNPS